jgi:pilus assembly protein CpaE
MTVSLKVVAVAASPEIQAVLKKQLAELDFIRCSGVGLELSDAVRECHAIGPDVIIVDTTGNELEAGLFIQAIGMNPETPCVIYALHQQMEIGIFKDTIRKGATECIQYPDDSDGLEIALRKHLKLMNRVTHNERQAANASHAAPKAPEGKIITVFSAKGGVGCSTVAVNVAHELAALSGKPTVFFDLDQVFCNTGIMINQKPSYSLSDIAATDPRDIDAALLEKIIFKPDGSSIHAVVGSKSVLDDNEMISAELLKATLDYLVSKYPYIVVDLPTHVLDPYHQYMVENAEAILMVSTPDIPSLYRTRQYLDLAQKYLDMSKVKMVLNRSTMKAAYRMSNAEVEQEFRHEVFARIPNDWDLNVEASSLGRMISVVNPKSDVAKALQKLAEQIHGAGKPAKAEPVASEKPVNAAASLLGKLFVKDK